jgi:hypothetical protein
MSETEEPVKPPEDTVPSRAARHDRSDPVIAGWAVAARRSLLVFVGAGAAAELVVLLLAFAAPGPKPGAASLAGGGAALLYAFHHVDLVFDLPRSLFPPPEAAVLGPTTRLTLGLAPLLATAVILWALARAGRAVGEECGGGAIARGLHGTKVAVPYAAIAFGTSFLVRVSLSAGGEPGPTVHPAPLPALLWPLAMAVVAGIGGGVGSNATNPTGRWDRWVGAAIAGAWTMLWVGLALSFAGLLSMAAIRPQDTRAFVEALFSGGPLRGVVLAGLSILVIPNLAAWVFVPAMGGCTGVSGALSSCVLSYSRFPAGDIHLAGPPFPSGPIDLPHAPPEYLLFLLVPLVAVLVGGAVAAQRGAGHDRWNAAALGASAGALFGALTLGVSLASQVVVRVGGGPSGFFPEGTLRAGPAIASGALIALVWGIGGGAVGGWMWWLRSERSRNLPGPHEATVGEHEEQDQADPGPEAREVSQDQ